MDDLSCSSPVWITMSGISGKPAQALITGQDGTSSNTTVTVMFLTRISPMLSLLAFKNMLTMVGQVRGTWPGGVLRQEKDRTQGLAKVGGDAWIAHNALFEKRCSMDTIATVNHQIAAIKGCVMHGAGGQAIGNIDPFPMA